MQSAGTDGAWHQGSGVGWLPLPHMGAPGNKLAPVTLSYILPGACEALGPLPDPEGWQRGQATLTQPFLWAAAPQAGPQAAIGRGRGEAYEMRVGVRVPEGLLQPPGLNSSPAVGCLQLNRADVGISSRPSPSPQGESPSSIAGGTCFGTGDTDLGHRDA